MNVYAKINENAQYELDENGAGLPVFLVVEDAPDIDDEDMVKAIGELTGVDPQFVSLITQEEYVINVDNVGAEEELKSTGCCGGCCDCSCGPDDECQGQGGCCG